MEDAETSTLETFSPGMQEIANEARGQDISYKSPMFNVAVYVHRLSFILIDPCSNFSATCTMPLLMGLRIS